MLDPSTVMSMPWCNHAGSTRELATAVDPEGRVQWRVSLADLDGVAEFSEFAGMDRILVPLDAVRLTINGSTVHLRHGEQVRFAGEATVSVAPDRPMRALNVMTRRDAFQAKIVLRPAVQAMTENTHATVALGELAADVLLWPSGECDE